MQAYYLLLFCFLCFNIVPKTAEADNKSIVILVSADGFRWGDQWKVPTPHIHRLIHEGVQAFPGMMPSFPTLTVTNHYSIATGLYPSSHGIIANYFRDPATNSFFSKSDTSAKWWIGEPIWETVVKNGLKAAVYNWPGGAVVRKSWKCPRSFCTVTNGTEPLDTGINATLSYLDLPNPPSLIAVYMGEPAKQEREFGPDSVEASEATSRVDAAIGKLWAGLDKRNMTDNVTVIVVGDHGMTGTGSGKLVYLEDFAPWGLNFTNDWVDFESYRNVFLGITPPPGVDPAEVVATMKTALATGKIRNGKYLQVFLKTELPERMHYSGSYRIPAIVGLLAEGYQVSLSRSNVTDHQEFAGEHGYDNKYISMRTVFFARGPRFPKGKNAPPFENVNVYNIITSILGIKGAPNNGSLALPNNILIPLNSSC